MAKTFGKYYFELSEKVNLKKNVKAVENALPEEIGNYRLTWEVEVVDASITVEIVNVKPYHKKLFGTFYEWNVYTEEVTSQYGSEGEALSVENFVDYIKDDVKDIL